MRNRRVRRTRRERVTSNPLRERKKLQESINVGRLPIKTEYEVGINYFLEKVLSIVEECKTVQEVGDLSISADYITEKLDRSVHAVEEYSRDLYLDMFNEETEGDWDYREEVYEKAKEIERDLNNISVSHIVQNVQSEFDDITYEAVAKALSVTGVILDRLAISFNARMSHFTNDLQFNVFDDDIFLNVFEDFVVAVEELLDQE